jgi:hypothetical protein
LTRRLRGCILGLSEIEKEFSVFFEEKTFQTAGTLCAIAYTKIKYKKK